MTRTRAARWLFLVAALCALAPMLVVFFDELFGDVPRGPFAGDYALLELCVRKAAHGKQLLGPFSRFGWTHPGPLYFYAVVPFYWLARGASAALHVAASAIQLGAAIAVLFVGARVVRTPVARAIALAAFVLATRAFLAEPYATGFASPWNPTVTVFPFALLVVLAAHCAGRGARGLSALMLLHAFVCQTHVGNVPIATAVVLASLAMRLRNGIRDVRWAAPVLTTLVVWSPVIVERDNLRALAKFFLHPAHANPFLHTVGYADRRIVGAHLPSLSIRNGLNLLVAVEIALLLGALVTRRREAARLAVIVALLLLMDFSSASRIQEAMFAHLTPTYPLTLPLAVAAIAACYERTRPLRSPLIGASAALLATVPFVLSDVRLARDLTQRDGLDGFGLDAAETAALLTPAIDAGRSLKLDARGDGAWAVLAGTLLALDKTGRGVAVAESWVSSMHRPEGRAKAIDLEVFLDADAFRDVVPIAKLRIVSVGVRRAHPSLARPRVASTTLTTGDTMVLTDGVDARGAAFDAPSSVVLDAKGQVTFDIGARDAVGIRVHADGNDSYQLLASFDGAHFVNLGLLPPVAGFGMQPRDFQFTGEPPRFVRITPAHGDGTYALSEATVLTAAPAVDAIEFGEPASRDRLVSGWSFDERNDRERYVWAQGTEARCVVHGGGDKRPLRLSFDVEPNDAPGREQSMTVLVGDSKIATLTLSAEKRMYDVVLPAALVQPRIELTLRFSYAIAPSTLDPTSTDRRPLAAAFHSLRVTRADAQWWE